MHSIRHYMESRLFWGVLPVLTVSSIILGLTIRKLDFLEFDETLNSKVQMLAAHIEHETDNIHLNLLDEYMPEFSLVEGSEGGEYFQLSHLDGTILQRSASLQYHQLPLPAPDSPTFTYMNVTLPNGQRGRLIHFVFEARLFDFRNDDKGENHVFANSESPVLLTLTLAKGLDGLNRLLHSIYTTLLVTDVLLLCMIFFLVRRTLERGMRPLVALNAQLRKIRADTLEKRISISDVPEELSLVVRSLNRLFENLQVAFDREQQFTSEVAHELRTPVAELRLVCDVGAQWAGDEAWVRQRFDELRQVARQMEKKVNGLLELSRLDRGAVQMDRASFVLGDFIQKGWDRLAETGNPRQVKLDNRVPDGLRVETDGVKLEMLFQNLLSNALTYSIQEGVVRIWTETDSLSRMILCIANSVTDLTEADVPRLFDRFWRKDLARTDGQHSGLGLPIVKSLADLLDIQIRPSMEAGNLFVFRLVFPKSYD